MKKQVYLFVFLVIIFLNGCVGTSHSRTSAPVQPRRVFETVEISNRSSTAPFIVREYTHDGSSYRKGSVYFSTALFLSDLGILGKITKEQFKEYASIIFTEFPREGQVKEIIIPNLSQSTDADAEKNAYLFLTRQKNSEGREYFLIESNIPIASINNRPYYDGYIMLIDGSFWKNQIPGSWTSIMFLHFVNNNLFYRGMAYPSKAAPLVITERGDVVLDLNMTTVISGKTTVLEIKNKLKETVEASVKNATPENQQQIDSIKRLEQYTNLSLSAYSYIDGNFNDAKNYFSLSERIIVDASDGAWGRRQNELRNIMNYLLNTIGE